MGPIQIERFHSLNTWRNRNWTALYAIWSSIPLRWLIIPRRPKRYFWRSFLIVFTNRSLKGFIKAKRYLASMGRYGNSPFLYPLYGSGEMTQCFCRLCGVFGGVYFLRFPLAGFTKDRSTEQCTGIASTTGERFRAKDSVICNSSFLSALSDNTQVLHRTVLITNRSIKSSEKEEVDKDQMDDQTLTRLL